MGGKRKQKQDEEEIKTNEGAGMIVFGNEDMDEDQTLPREEEEQKKKVVKKSNVIRKFRISQHAQIFASNREQPASASQLSKASQRTSTKRKC